MAHRVLLAAAASLLFGTAAAAEPVTVVHAIPGTALGLPTDDLTVDIDVNGACAFPGVSFQDSATTDVPVGRYDVAVSLSDGACTGAAAIVGSFEVALGETAVVVAHLNAAGAPTLSKFSVDGSDADTRLTLFHGAGAPPVQASGNFGKAKLKVGRLANGETSFPVDGAAGDLKLTLKPADGGKTVFSAKGVPVAGNLLVIAAGSLATETFQPVIVEIGAAP